MYLLDTTVWIDLIRTNSPPIRRKLATHSKSVIALSIITACELQYGLERHAAKYPYLRTRQQSLLENILASFEVLALDHGVMEIYGRLRAKLESSGHAIGSLDTFIAAHALSVGATLVTSNAKEFSRVPGLHIEDWR